MDELRIVTVTADGQAGDQVGAWQWDGETITGTGPIVTSILDGLRIRSRWDDARLWQHLITEGWSNGQLMTQAPPL